MDSQTSVVLSQSGAPLKVPNGLVDATSISVTYTVAGAPASLSISVTGIKNAAGECALLDTYVGTANTTRSISLLDTYDFFQFVATWTGGTNVTVSGAMTSTGAGPQFNSDSLTAVQTFSSGG